MELVYLVTTACNYRCSHCNSNLWTPKVNELSVGEFVEIYEKSNILKKCYIAISGGEPFLKPDFEKLVEYLNKKGAFCSITTNGRFTNKVYELISKIGNKELIQFAVSIDGDEKTHNAIRGGEQQDAYQHAYDTVKLLREQDFAVQINMVIQKSNFPLIDTMGKEFEAMGAELNYIPVIAYEEKAEDKFSLEERCKIYDYLKSRREKKLLLSEGTYKIKNCHAAKASWILDSNGDLYACFGGLNAERSEEFKIGNIKEKGLDYLVDSGKAEIVYQSKVANCEGCAWPCEIDREVYQYGLSTEVSVTEAEKTFGDRLKSSCSLAEYELDNQNWHALEKNQIGSYRWMRGKRGKIFLGVNDMDSPVMQIRCLNPMPTERVVLRVYVNGLRLGEDKLCYGINVMNFVLNQKLRKQILEVTLETNLEWIPKEQNVGNDERKLGIALYELEIKEG